jgi:hypothetical protein
MAVQKNAGFAPLQRMVFAKKKIENLNLGFSALRRRNLFLSVFGPIFFIPSDFSAQTTCQFGFPV